MDPAMGSLAMVSVSGVTRLREPTTREHSQLKGIIRTGSGYLSCGSEIDA